MKKIQNRLFMAGLFSVMFVMMLAGQAFGSNFNKAKTGCRKFSNQQIGETPESRILLTRCVSKKEEKPVGRTTFVKNVTVNLNGLDVKVVAMQIPAGKRLVIENVTAIVRSPESQRVEVNYFTYTNNGGVAERTIHDLALEKQASFKDSAIFTTNQKTAVFADEQIGSEHFSVGISARLVGVFAQFAQAQFTFSGYLEDLPAN